MAIEPVTREERFLAAAGGRSVTPPEPITRKEQLLQGIIDAVNSGGATPDVIEGAVNDYLNANPVKPGATTEQAAQIEQNKTDIAYLQVEIDDKQPKGDYVKTVNGNKPDANGNVVVVTGGNGSGENVGLTTEQIAALDGMFKVCAFTKDDISAEYDAFCVAFGIQNSNTCLHPLPDGEVTHDGLTVRVSGGNHVEVIAADDVAVSNGFANLSALNERNATGFPRSALQRNDAIYPTIPTGSVVELSIYNVEYTTLDAFFFEVIFAGNSGGGLMRHIVVDATNSSVTATAEVDWNSAGLGIGNSFKPGTASFDILLIVDGVRWI